MQHVPTPGQAKLRRRDDEVELAKRRPRATDNDELGPPAGLRANPSRDILVGTKGEDQQIRPGRLQWARTPLIHPRKRGLEEQVGDELELLVYDALDLERPTECFGEADHLRVIALPVAGKHPDQRQSSAFVGRSNAGVFVGGKNLVENIPCDWQSYTAHRRCRSLTGIPGALRSRARCFLANFRLGAGRVDVFASSCPPNQRSTRTLSCPGKKNRGFRTTNRGTFLRALSSAGRSTARTGGTTTRDWTLNDHPSSRGRGMRQRIDISGRAITGAGPGAYRLVRRT